MDTLEIPRDYQIKPLALTRVRTAQELADLAEANRRDFPFLTDSTIIRDSTTVGIYSN